MSTLPHDILFPGHVYHITFSTHGKFHLFVDSHLYMLFMNSLKRSSSKYSLHVIAWVVMPNHVHLLITPASETPSGLLFHHLKKHCAFHAVRFLKETYPNLAAEIFIETGTTHHHQFWMHRRGYIRVLFDEEDVIGVLNYLHENPVRWGLVEKPEDWRWSSAEHWSSHQQQDGLPNPPGWLTDTHWKPI